MNHLHDYQEISNTSEAQVEVCRECKHKLITRKDRNGRIDNEKYLKEHIRDTAQPGGRTKKIFKKYYGKAKV
jgi:predicted Rdx family selenoprotein